MINCDCVPYRTREAFLEGSSRHHDAGGSPSFPNVRAANQYYYTALWNVKLPERSDEAAGGKHPCSAHAPAPGFNRTVKVLLYSEDDVRGVSWDSLGRLIQAIPSGYLVEHHIWCYLYSRPEPQEIGTRHPIFWILFDLSGRTSRVCQASSGNPLRQSGSAIPGSEAPEVCPNANLLSDLVLLGDVLRVQSFVSQYRLRTQIGS